MTRNQNLRIMLADDHAVVRAGIRRLLELQHELSVVAECDSGENAYEIYGIYTPDILVMDLSMPGMGGLEAIGRIINRFPEAKILVLSMHLHSAFLSQALKAGAKGYVSKSSLADELADALQIVAQGKTYLSADVAKKYTAQTLLGENNRPLEQLTSKEFEIFRMLAEGKDIDDIAEAVKVSPKTIANYQTVLKKKLGVHSAVEIVRLAIRHGLIES